MSAPTATLRLSTRCLCTERSDLIRLLRLISKFHGQWLAWLTVIVVPV
jgi:hypothetical protein